MGHEMITHTSHIRSDSVKFEPQEHLKLQSTAFKQCATGRRADFEDAMGRHQVTVAGTFAIFGNRRRELNFRNSHEELG